MQTSPETEKRICAMFDSFCKKVIRNYSRNLKRAAANQRKHFSTGSMSVQYLLNSLTIEDWTIVNKVDRKREKINKDFQIEQVIKGY